MSRRKVLMSNLHHRQQEDEGAGDFYFDEDGIRVTDAGRSGRSGGGGGDGSGRDGVLVETDHESESITNHSGKDPQQNQSPSSYQKTLFWPLVVCVLLLAAGVIVLGFLLGQEMNSNNNQNDSTSGGSSSNNSQAPIAAPSLISTATPSLTPTQTPTRPPQMVNTVVEDDVYETVMTLDFDRESQQPDQLLLNDAEIELWRASTELYLESYFKQLEEEGTQITVGSFTLHNVTSTIGDRINQTARVSTTEGIQPSSSNASSVIQTSVLQLTYPLEVVYMVSTFFGNGEISQSDEPGGLQPEIIQELVVYPFVSSSSGMESSTSNATRTTTTFQTYVEYLQQNISQEIFRDLQFVEVSVPEPPPTGNDVENGNNSSSNITDPNNIFEDPTAR